MNLPYLTGGFSLPPDSLTAVTVIHATMYAGAGTARSPACLHAFPVARENISPFPNFACHLLMGENDPFWEGTTPLDEKKLFFSQDDGYCSHDRQVAWRSEGILGLT